VQWCIPPNLDGLSLSNESFYVRNHAPVPMMLDAKDGKPVPLNGNNDNDDNHNDKTSIPIRNRFKHLEIRRLSGGPHPLDS
jgi:hypothetical protein